MSVSRADTSLRGLPRAAGLALHYRAIFLDLPVISHARVRSYQRRLKQVGVQSDEPRARHDVPSPRLPLGESGTLTVVDKLLRVTQRQGVGAVTV